MLFSRQKKVKVRREKGLDHQILSALKQRGRKRKGSPESIQKFRLRKWPISSADFPMTPMERTEHHFGPVSEKDFGATSGGPSSPGPFVSLLILPDFGAISGSPSSPGPFVLLLILPLKGQIWTDESKLENAPI